MRPLQIRSALALPAGLRTVLFATSAAHPHVQYISSPSTTRPLSTTAPRHPADLPNSPTPAHSSVSDTEVSHFNALASSWWDPQGSSRLLHLMNPLRHDFIKQCLSSHVRATDDALRYVDVGCGGGIFAESAARLPTTQSVTAIDPSAEVIAVAKRHQRQDPLLLQQGRLSYKNMAIEDLPLPTNAEADSRTGYDILTLFEVIEHIRQPSTFLQSCIKHIKPGGWLIGSTIARTNASWFTTKFVAEDMLGLVPRGTHNWDQYIQPDEMRNWARAQPELDADFQGWQVMGVVYVPAVGWKAIPSSEDWGNYFFGIRKRETGR